MAPMAGSVPTFLSFRDAEDRNKDCFYLGRRLDAWSVNGVKEFDFNPGVFHFVELDVDWVGKQVTLTVDRQVVGTSGFHSDCITGMGTMALFGKQEVTLKVNGEVVGISLFVKDCSPGLRPWGILVGWVVG
eukprot:TRINITY_DN12603_c0_g1_i2.p3 TRINITY_DN12603_c0_g1~~TRINITY_DN12603_c0_g1_i2.p3  ORF type:complete len:131 (+),score=18.49 TRINITY_DN12603_c0_g1_i2:504-896(+)